jgi:hypothetical protein
MDLSAGFATATIRVVNVAPTITQFGLFDSLGLRVGLDVPFVIQGLPVTAKGAFTDPGTPDHQTANLNWGDGTTDPSSAFGLFTDAFGGVTGQLEHAHPYAIAGELTLELQVTDDDAGTGSASAVVKVLTPAAAVTEIIHQLDDLIAGATSDAERKALLNARKALEGSVSGLGANGVLDKLDKASIQSALIKLRQAISYLLVAQESGADVGILIVLLLQIGAAITP